MDGTEPRKFLTWKFLSHELIYETNFFITWGDDAVQARTSNLALYSYYCDAYLSIIARITVHDSYYIALSSMVTSVPLFIPSINTLRHPTASKNSAWILDSCRSADIVLSEHSAAITLSRRGEVVKGVSGMIYCCLSCLRSALFTGMNTLRRDFSVDLCTWVGELCHLQVSRWWCFQLDPRGCPPVPFSRPKTIQQRLRHRQHHQPLAYSRCFTPGYYVPCQCSQWPPVALPSSGFPRRYIRWIVTPPKRSLDCCQGNRLLITRHHNMRKTNELNNDTNKSLTTN